MPLVVYIQFISSLIAYSSPASWSSFMPCVTSCIVVVAVLLLLCWSSSIGFFCLPQLFLLSQLFHCSGLLQPLLYSVLFALHVGVVCLYFACWDSLSGFTLPCWDSVSGFSGLWLTVADWCLSKGVNCKCGCDWWLFIVCTQWDVNPIIPILV